MHLLQINGTGAKGVGDYAIQLSDNKATGGTCNGDSGGPNFLGDSLVIGGVTSYGRGGSCLGVSGAYRMDREGALTWVRSYVQANGVPPPAK